jgi:hypothetical protein
VRRAADLPKENWQQKLHKVRVTEPVGYGGANRILAVFHWDDDYDRYKRDGYYLVGRVDFVAAGAQQYINQMIQFFAESSSQHMLWTDQKGKVLYDQRNPEIVNQKAASVLRYRGAVYCEAATRPTDNSIWYHASDNILVEPMRPLYLSDSPLEYLGKYVYAFTIDPTAIWGDITHHHEYQNGIWMPLVHESMDSVGDNLGTVIKLAKAGFDVVWDRRDYAAGYAQIFVVNPNILTEINSEY